MCSYVICFIFARIFLANQVITNVSKGNKVSKKDGCWYFIKCSKYQNCSDLILNNFQNDDISIISNNSFTAFLSKNSTNKLSILNLKFRKISKGHKQFHHHFDHHNTSYSNSYLIYSTKSCKIPFSTSQLSSNFFIFQTDEPYQNVSQKINKIGCVRSFERLHNPRLNSQFSHQKLNNNFSHQSVNKKLINNNEITKTLNINNDTDKNEIEKDFFDEISQISLISSKFYKTLQKYGIKGDNQIASIVDSGLDSQLCWFEDPERDIEYNTISDHRKIEAYFPYADKFDSKGGHGSFIAGLIAGSAICDVYNNEDCRGTFFNGVAPNSKLIINDIYKNNDLVVPNNSSSLFSIPQQLSACVQYHGFDFKEKSLFTALIDTIAYENPKLLLVFAAGDIENTTQVSSPGDSKNVLTVGANPLDIRIINELDTTSPIVVKIINENNQNDENENKQSEKETDKISEFIGYCDLFNGISYFSYLIQNGISNWKNLRFQVRKNVFVEGIEKINNDAISLTNIDLIILFNQDDFRVKVNKPIIRLPGKYAKLFMNCKEVEINLFTDIDSYHINNIKDNHSKYSRSNSKYLRRKPNIYFPGGPIYGPNAGTASCDFNGVKIGEGTSVSAALATGNILLIRHYLNSGFYPDYINCSNTNINLNKTIDQNITFLNNNTDNPRFDYFNDNNYPVIETTSHMLRAILSNIADDSGTPNLEKLCIFHDEYYHDKNENELYGIRFYSDSLKSNSHHKYFFKAQHSGDLKISIAWNDPPHDPFAPSDILFRVDVRIESSTGSVYGDLHYDYFNTVKDFYHHVEKDEEYNIYVICGDNMFFGLMNYTIVISGPFDHFNNNFIYKNNPLNNDIYINSNSNENLTTNENNQNNENKGSDSNDQKNDVKCIQKCAEGSKCVNGFCICGKNQFGVDCSKVMNQLTNHQSIKNVVLNQHESFYCSYVFKQWKPGSKLQIDLSNNTNQLFYMFSINSPPTWHNANCNSENCQWITKEQNSLILEYHFWDFVQNNDILYFEFYSLEEDITFDITITLHHR